jgi:hypothetical protein
MLQEMQRSYRLGLPKNDIFLAEDILVSIPEEYRHLLKTVFRRELDELLLTRGGSYICALKTSMALMNSALFCEELVLWMLDLYPDRFRVYEDTKVQKIIMRRPAAVGADNCMSNASLLTAGQNTVYAKHAVLCTNGYNNLEIEGTDALISEAIQGIVGFLVGYLHEEEKGPAAAVYFNLEKSIQPEGYFYLARRRYVEGTKRELTSIGGLDRPLRKNEKYRPESVPDVEMYYSRIDEFYRKTAIDMPADIQDIKRDFSWNGLMGYTSSGVRVIGTDPRHPSLIYNLGCNGIGILPSIYGGKRIAQVINGERLTPSIFDPIFVSPGLSGQ